MAVANLLIMALFVGVAILTVDELLSRQDRLESFDQELAEVQHTLTSAGQHPSPADSADYAAVRSRAAALRTARRNLTTLIGTGGASGTSVRAINESLGSPRSRPPVPLLGGVEKLSNSRLLVILLLVCGGIGSGITGLRSSRINVRQIGQGLAAGFITFLVVTGGYKIFLVQVDAADVTFNPTSCGMFAVAAGLFTERAHRLVAKLVEHFSFRVEQVVTGAAETPATKPPAANGARRSAPRQRKLKIEIARTVPEPEESVPRVKRA
ncbi:MAG TPA: hypothetical protein VFX98_01330 [Longimicrobiaceae bacterium]|nr:hypothetical protein [Longimicrobiaceae bacterium]